MEKHITYLTGTETLSSFEEWEIFLGALINGPCITSIDPQTGKLKVTLTFATVARINDFRIDIHPDDHAPPHFHVISSSFNASYRISDCELLEGEISRNVEKKVKDWYKGGAKEILIVKWDQTRPTDCEVGPYAG